MDPYKLLRISQNPDGSLIRHTNPRFPDIPTDPNNPNPIFKDILLNSHTNTFIRIFRPETPTTHKLPIILYFHGGGFILYSPKSYPFHQSCLAIASYLPALVLSVDYRLAPEHRLPAAYQDAVESINWVKDQALNETGDPWLRDSADFNSIFLMGNSAGGNIAYNAYLRLPAAAHQIYISGLILDQPYFGGVNRTKSELRLANDKVLPLTVNDLLWALSLPTDADRDHIFSNPQLDRPLPRCLVRGYGGDPLVDRQMEFCRMLDACGTQVVVKFDEDGFHGVDMFKPAKAKALYQDVKTFVYLSRHQARPKI